MARACSFLWSALLVLWALVAWSPPASHPLEGMLAMAALAILLMSAGLVRRGSAPAGRNPAAMAAFIALGWFYMRWAMTGWRTSADDEVIAMGLAVAFGCCACWLLDGWRGAGRPAESMLRGLHGAVVVGAVVCGLHALFQRYYHYDRVLADFEAALAGRTPDRAETALLHHLRLKRVASVWGDPNVLGAFLGMSAASSVCLVHLSRMREGAARIAWIAAGLAGLGAAATGIMLAGSRGGLMTFLLVLVLTVALLRWKAVRIPAAAVLLAFAMVSQAVPEDATAENSQQSGLAAMLSRNDTIRERLHYARTGMRIVADYPVVGAGPGGVDALFGLYKPAEARESKYLHNWPLQLAAESGLVGAALFAAAFGLMLLCAWRRAVGAGELAVLAMSIGFLTDSLYSLGFHQQGLAALFGILAGCMVHLGRGPVAAGGGVRSWGVWAVAAAVVAFMAAHGVPSVAASLYNERADAALEEGDLEAARAAFRRAEAWQRHNPRFAMGLAAVEERSGSAERALLHLARASRLAPHSAIIRAERARLELASGQPKEALASIEEAIARYPANANYWRQKAVILENIGQLSEAATAAEAAVEHAVYDRDEQTSYLLQLRGKAAGIRNEP